MSSGSLRPLLGLACFGLAACPSTDKVADQPVELSDISYTVEMPEGGALRIDEADQEAALLLRFDGRAPRSFRLTYTVSGDPEDIATGSETIAVSAGTETVAIPLAPIDDLRIEQDEQFTVSFAGDDARFAPSSVAVTLTSDDAPYVLSVSEATITEPDRGGIAYPLMVTLDRPAVGAIVLPFTVETTHLTEGQDFDAIEQDAIIIPDGAFSASITVTFLGDDLDEDTGILGLRFEDTDEVLTQAGENVARVFVEDFEPAPIVSFEIDGQVASEAAGFARVRVVATPPSKQPIEARVRISGSAGRDVDYTIPDDFDRFVIPAAAPSTSVDITLIDDTVPEGNETIRLDLDPPDRGTLGTPAVHTLTLFGGVALNDTGVRSRIAGAGPGQDADHGRDAELGRPGFSFTKIDSDGNPVAPNAPPGSWRCVRDNVTGLTWEAKSRNLDASTGEETPFVRAEEKPDFDIDGDGRPDVNTQPAIGADDWRAWNARFLWWSDNDATNGGIRGSLGNLEGNDLNVSPGPQSAACGYRPLQSSERQEQANALYQDCLDAQAAATPENPGPAFCRLPLIDDGFAAPSRSHDPWCNTDAYREELLFLNVCGVTGWRLPSIEELRGLVSYADGEQGIDYSLFFPFAPASADLTLWSADTVPARLEQGQVYCMSPSDGVTLSCTKNITHEVLMVSE